jgi:4-hydroxybutyrate CoA-transferase
MGKAIGLWSNKAVSAEFGAVNLHGKTLRERGEALISIAHPDFRVELRKALAAIRHFVLS